LWFGTYSRSWKRCRVAPVGKTINIKRLVQDYSMDKNIDSSASITSEELIVSKENGSKMVYSLRKDEFFVLIALYVVHTLVRTTA